MQTYLEPVGAPSFAHSAKGGIAQTSTFRSLPGTNRGVPHPSRTLRRVGDSTNLNLSNFIRYEPWGAPSFAHFAKGGTAQTSTSQSLSGTNPGCPILRALCEGWDSTNLNLPFSTRHEPRGAPSFAHFAKGGIAQTSTSQSLSGTNRGVPHPSRTLRRVG